MRWRGNFSVAAAVSLVALMPFMAGCGASSSSGPSGVSYTDIFTGRVTAGTTSYGDGNRNHFTIHNGGNISVTITKLSPDSTITVGLGLGLYDTGSATCSLSFGDNRTLNVPLLASTAIPGEVCVGVVDVGSVIDSADYEVTVIHT